MLGIATAAIMARVLIKEDVAAYRQAWLAYGTLGPLLTMGVGQGMYYFLPEEEEECVRGRVADGMFILAILGLAFSVFLACGGNELLARRFSNPQVARLLLWMIPYAIISAPASVTPRILVARDHVNVSAALGIVSQLIVGILTIVPLLIWRNAESATAGNVSGGVIMACVSLTIARHYTPAGSFRPRLSGIRELLIFGVPLGLSSSIGTLNRQLDKFIVGFMDSPANFAEFSYGAIEIPFIGMVTGAVTSVLLIDMRKAVKAEDNSEALRLFRLTSEKTSLVLFPMMAFFMVCADDLVCVLYTSEYQQAAVPFRWYLAVLPIRTAFFGSLLVALGMTRFLLLRSIVSLVCNAIFSVAFVWWLGPYGAAVSTMAVKYVWAVPVSLWMLSRSLDCRWTEVLPFGQLTQVMAQMIPVALVAWLISSFIKPPLFSLVSVCIVFAMFLLYWWHDKLYTSDQIRSLISKLTGNHK